MIVTFLIIILSLLFLIAFSYKGYSTAVIAPLISFIVLFSVFPGSTVDQFHKVFVSAAGHFIGKYIILFIVGSIMGKIIVDSGIAESLANYLYIKLGEKYAIIIVVVSTSMLAYSGVSSLVVAFVIYPFAKSLFYSLDIPKKLIIPAITLGGFTYSVLLPGSSQLINVIPTTFLGTTLYSDWLMSLIISLLIFFLGVSWLVYKQKRYKSKSIGYGYTEKEEISFKKLPSPFIALFIVVFMFSGNYILTQYFGITYQGVIENLEFLKTQYAVVSTLTLISFILAFTLRNYFTSLKKTLSHGVSQAMSPMIATAAVVGYGSVIISIDIVNTLQYSFAQSISNESFLISSIVVFFSTFSGSGSGGLFIALENMFGNNYLYERITAVPIATVHTVATFSTIAVSVLPQNGGLISLMAISKMKYKDCYKDVFITCILFPVLILIGLLFLI